MTKPLIFQTASMTLCSRRYFHFALHAYLKATHVYYYIVTWLLRSITSLTSNDIIAGDGRKSFMIELKFIEKYIFKVLLNYLTNCSLEILPLL